MKRLLQHIAILFLSTASMEGQEWSESYLLITDRGHYISGEELFFGIHSLHPESEVISTSYYVELIDPRGQALLRSKISLGPGGGEGKFLIPDGISSGTYYLKGYSRWMRNCGAASFSYTSIQVYDPYTSTVLAPDTTGRSGYQEFDFSDAGTEDELLAVDLSEDLVRTRENMQLILESREGYDTLDFSLSIVQKGLLSGQHFYRSTCRQDVDESSRFIPETRGVSISGRAVSAVNGRPASYATVYLSVLGKQREFFCNYADSAGRFYFSLPDRYGSYELFISTHHSDYEELELLIDSDFSNEELQLPSYPVKVDSSLAERINEMSVNAQVNRQYYPPGSEPGIEDTLRETTLFYGHPTVTVSFADFINLPTLAEYFYEVIPQVSVRRNRNRTTFLVNGLHPDLRLYQPLVMIDGVAIFDMEALLEVSPRLIDRVEIITAPYLRSDVTFGGIISLITKENNMGYIDLPSSGLLLKYQMLEREVPEDPIPVVSESMLPDTRNTLLWEPFIRLEPAEDLSLDFTTADSRGPYEVLIRGWTSAGKPFEKRLSFEVQ